MYFAPIFTHFPACHLGEPVVDPGKDGKDRPRRDHIVEMRDDIIAVVQRHVAEVETERKAGQPPDTEHRQESQSKQHRRVETDRTAPKRNEKTS